MGSTQELLSRIRELELENMELKSKLDQYQSIFSPGGSGPPLGGLAGADGGLAGASGRNEPRMRRVNRGVGISAEPQSLRSLKDLTNKSFPEFKKSEK